MEVQFRDILAREARRRRKEQEQALIDQLSPAASKLSQAGEPWSRQRSSDRFDNESGLGARYAQDRDTGTARRRRKRNDGWLRS
jgi:hypothetical protein